MYGVVINHEYVTRMLLPGALKIAQHARENQTAERIEEINHQRGIGKREFGGIPANQFKVLTDLLFASEGPAVAGCRFGRHGRQFRSPNAPKGKLSRDEERSPLAGA
jgi:hypothetical protein